MMNCFVSAELIRLDLNFVFSKDLLMLTSAAKFELTIVNITFNGQYLMTGKELSW